MGYIYPFNGRTKKTPKETTIIPLIFRLVGQVFRNYVCTLLCLMSLLSLFNNYKILIYCIL